MYILFDLSKSKNNLGKENWRVLAFSNPKKVLGDISMNSICNLQVRFIYRVEYKLAIIVMNK